MSRPPLPDTAVTARAAASTRQQARQFANDRVRPDRIAIAQSWFRTDTADYWRHARMYACADHLAHRGDASWLTVGDGRWGLDAIRLRRKGFSRVVASDVSDHLLGEAKRQGLVDTALLADAEVLPLADAVVDYVLCKESLHHFPRPYLALYEMLRVARRGVFLIEPNDRRPGLDAYAAWLDARRAGKNVAPPEPDRLDFEGCGNYVFSVSRRELEKIALALNLPQLVTKGLNDHYEKGCEFEPADADASPLFARIRAAVAERDAACLAGRADYELLMAGLCLEPLDATARQAFAADGWQVCDLPRNPHGPTAG